MNLDFAKVCGKHNAIYEAYYKQIDPKGAGAIEAMTAAKFLKKSGLSDVVLSRIWDLSDPNGKGFLDKPGFFISLKLVSLAQAGLTINMSNIYAETSNPPKVGDLPKIIPPRIQTVPVGSGAVDWAIKVVDRLKYEQLFDSLKPVNGFLAGNKVKGVLMDSKLPMDTLGKIWDLADQDKDGNLDKHEFIIAMHLVYQTLDKRSIPAVLPPELRKSGLGGPPPKPQPPAAPPSAVIPRAPSGENFGDGGFVANFPKDIAPPPVPALPVAIPPMTRVQPPSIIPMQLIPTDPLISIGAPPSATTSVDWVVTPTDLKRYEVIFRDSDRDKDGLVSGLEVKNVFIQSGVPQNCLAHIWALCDTNQSGKLTLEQFALAMWMVERKQKGLEPPQVLTANMVPPTLRGIVPGVDLTAQIEPKPTYSNPELEMISKEIEELAKERRSLETEIAQKEADIRIKSGEVRSLQSELDTLTATLKQLENQRGEAQKRLDDLKAQKSEYENAITNTNLDIVQLRNQVNKIREQCQKQEETINEQEGELNSKKSEMQKLKDEEAALEKEYDENRKELDNLTKHLQDTQLQISQVRSMVTQLLETQRQMTDALIMCRAAIESNNTELVTEYQLKIEPNIDEARLALEKKADERKVDPFQSNATNGFGKSSNAVGTAFASNGFAADAFSGTAAARGNSAFDDSFSGSVTGGFDDAFSSGGFAQQRDPFGGSGASDPFGAAKSSAVTPEPGKDDFGSDPFAALHAPTGVGQVLSPNAQKSGPPPRPESPSPALPPKKAKQPPPRPAPPRPVQGPSRPAQPSSDAFGNASPGSGFADFADFDNKQPSIPPPQLPLPSQPTLLDPPLAEPFVSSSSLQSTQPSTASSTISSSITNNFLNRSATPLATTAQAIPATKLVPAKSVTPIINGPTDFTDDPFKDYRYEYFPFSVKDPFADDFLEGEEIDSCVYVDDAKNRNQKITSNANALSSQIFAPADSIGPMITTKSSSTVSSNEFLDQFDAFNSNPSPAPSTLSSGATANSIKSQRNTPVSSILIGASSSSTVTQLAADDAFADFDAFSTMSSTKSASSALVSGPATTKAATTSPSPLMTDSFFDAFNDNFTGFDTNSNNKSNRTPAVAAAFDAFGDSKAFESTTHQVTNTILADDAFSVTATTKQNQKNKSSNVMFDDFNDNGFEDDFFKIKLNDNGNANLNFGQTNTTSDANNGNFAKFDAFGENFVSTTSSISDFSTTLNNSKNLNLSTQKLSKVQNKTSLKKANNNNHLPNFKEEVGSSASVENGGKLLEKFAKDYSNADSFDADLEDALKRSISEK